MILKETREGGIKEREPGVYDAICTGLIDIGTHMQERYNKEQHQVIIQFELVDEFYTDSNGQERRAKQSQFYTLSVHEKANLRKALRGWRGRDFTPEELKGFDLKNVLGKPCKLVIVHSESGKAVIDNILKYDGTAIEPQDQVRFFSFDDFNGTFPEWMSEKIVGLIQKSNEYSAFDSQTGGIPTNNVNEFMDEVPF